MNSVSKKRVKVRQMKRLFYLDHVGKRNRGLSHADVCEQSGANVEEGQAHIVVAEQFSDFI